MADPMRRTLPALALLSLAACQLPPPASSTPDLGPPPGTLTDITTLPGWDQDNTAQALATFVLSCQTLSHMPPDTALGGAGLAASLAGQAGLWQSTCDAAKAVTPGDDAAARSFFETSFAVYALPDNAVVTGYFEPEYPGSKNLAKGYAVPLYAKPADATLAALPRSAIDGGALNRQAPVTAYLTNPVDAFMLQVQGAGRILLPNGNTLRVGYDGQNGQPYTPIGRILVQQGDLASGDVSFQSISDWLTAHPAQATGLMEQNANYAFMKPLGTLPDNEGAPGALGVPLTAGRTLAVDKSVLPLGAPVFLVTTDPVTQAALDRLTIAQDTDSGFTDGSRAGLFFGSGPDAEASAGVMRQPGTLYLLLPKPAAAPAS
jgi:membrane-bound lytic murein transglycosylase A